MNDISKIFLMTYLVVKIVFVDMIFMDDELDVNAYSIYVHRFQLSSLERCFFITGQIHIPSKKRE